MEELTELPAVATNFYTSCKKCDAERYHRVLTHTKSGSAKMECEVCGAKKTFKLSAQGKKKTKKKRSTKAANAEAAHLASYEALQEKFQSTEADAYSMNKKFKNDQPISHPKFGVGFIQLATPNKIEVIFKDQVRALVHNRT